MPRDYKTINVSTDVWELLQDVAAVTGEPMKEIAEEAVKTYVRNNRTLRTKVLAYRDMMGRIGDLD